MKSIKKVTAFFLAALMALAMSCTTFAADGPTAKDFPERPQNTKEASMAGHTFNAYQIFSGTQSEEEGENELVDINWGAGINGEAFLTALKASGGFGEANPFSAITYDSNATFRSAQAVAKIVAGWSPDGENARTFASIAQKNLTDTISGSYHIAKDDDDETTKLDIKAGYYLIVDVTDVDSVEDAVKNLSILQLTKEHEFKPTNKTDIPELEKKVKEINDSDSSIQDEWKDAADYDIGDDVEFVLTGTLPTDYGSYTKYKYVFHDTLSTGLSLNQESIKVYLQNSETVTVLEDYTVATNVQKEDSLTGETVTESFTVTFENLKKNDSINRDSVIRVVYTAKLLDTAVIGGSGNSNTAYLQYSNDPNYDEDGEGPTGETPEDKVVVFTYALIVNKKQDTGETNEGKPVLEDLKGAGFTLYKYNKNSTAATEEEKYEAVGEEIKGGDVVQFEFKGVDAGKYKLVETTVPQGYNKAEDMYFTINATVDEKNNVTSLVIEKVNGANGEEIKDAGGNKVFEFTSDKTNGTLTTDILNLKGVVLPSTGGIGTTIFYLLGAVMALGAGVLLVTRRRMRRTR